MRSWDKGLKVLFAASFVVATAAFVLGPLVLSSSRGPSNEPLVDFATHVSLLLSVLWLILLTVGLFRFKKSGLWVLIGLPFALFWFILPCLDLLIFLIRCIVNTGHCP
jgi:hypothetical protein